VGRGISPGPCLGFGWMDVGKKVDLTLVDLRSLHLQWGRKEGRRRLERGGDACDAMRRRRHARLPLRPGLTPDGLPARFFFFFFYPPPLKNKNFFFFFNFFFFLRFEKNF